jgi:hypothetical protein
MKGGAQTAVAIGVGYILGRRRKWRKATILAVAAATGGLGGLSSAAVKRGLQYLGSTDIGDRLGPQVSEVVSTVRGDLLDAGKAAATAAVSNRIDSLSDTLHDRAERVKNPEAAVAGAGRTAGKAAGRVGAGAGRLRRGRRAGGDEPEDEYDEEELYEDEPVDEDGEPVGDEEPVDEDELVDENDEDDGAFDEDDEAADEDEEPASRRRRTSRSPVARTRR